MTTKKAAPEGTKKWTVYGSLAVSVHVEVYAATEEEAREKALEFGTPTLCHHCTRGGHDRGAGVWRLGDALHGEVTPGDVEECE